MSVEKLYNTLVQQDLLSLSIEDFSKKLEDTNYQQKVHKAIVDNDLYSFDFNTFNNQYLVGLEDFNKLKKQEQKEPLDGGFFEDLYVSMQQGFDAGFSVNEAFDVYKQGANISDEDLEAYINAVSRMDKSQKTNEQYLFQKAVEENGGGFFWWYESFI